MAVADLVSLYDEVRLMRHHVEHGVPRTVTPTTVRWVCRRGHVIASEWDEDSRGWCRRCVQVTANRRNRLSTACE